MAYRRDPGLPESGTAWREYVDVSTCRDVCTYRLLHIWHRYVIHMNIYVYVHTSTCHTRT